ncbi:SGNH/GDSL hydrolase family protein [Streptomyces sp. NPDC026659]|uniref:SGNH/GDSL hydrolase family protein n=1 Tax=Streptomyces sp. NPDC026659 TaxID=3155123 RepID=UPI0033C353A3
MTGRLGRACRTAAVLLAALAVQTPPLPTAAHPTGDTGHALGVVTWAASAGRLGHDGADRSYRLVVRTSVGGSGLRVRLSNAFGDRPLRVNAAYAGLREQGAAVRDNRRLAFHGRPSVTIPRGAVVWSDPLPGHVPAGALLAVSLHTPDAAGPATGHALALRTSYTARGDHTAEESAAPWTRTTDSWWYLDAVSVRPDHPATGAVAALGDSITDGRASTPDRDLRWPDLLARRLARTALAGVAGEGISGNRVLTEGGGTSALGRLDRDVLELPGVRTVILFEGVNDLKAATGVTAADLIAGYREVVRRAHAAGMCVTGATVAPFRGWPEWSPAAEDVRREVNHRIRTGHDFDAVADFDRALRDPRHPERMRTAYDSGDHLHPNDRGMRALADAVDLARLRCDR